MSQMFELMAIPFAACVVLVGIHSYLGMHVIQRKIIFVDLALAQIAALGATFQQGLVNGTVSSSAFAVGHKLMFFNAFLPPYQMNLILSMHSLMERLSACIKRQAAQKGDSQSGHWAFKRRIDDQSTGSH